MRARLIRRSDRALFGAHHDREAIVLGHGFLLFIIRFESGFFVRRGIRRKKKERKGRIDFSGKTRLAAIVVSARHVVSAFRG